MDFQNDDPQARSVNAYFDENVTKFKDVLKDHGAEEEVLQI